VHRSWLIEWVTQINFCLPENITLALKRLPGANTAAYFASTSMRKKNISENVEQGGS
jgi:hypothetical protein